MFNYSFIFEHPNWLWLLLLLPVVAWLSRQSLSGLGRWRRWFAVGFRMAVMSLLIMALAGMQFQKKTDKLTVIYILDQSMSIPETHRGNMVGYVNASIKKHRTANKGDRAGVIVFGRDAAVELPPFDGFLPLRHQIETELDQDFTNLSGAMRRAAALFTGDSAKRVVIVSDGNENLGDAKREARALTEAGVSIDVVAVPLPERDEISVEKIAIPSDVRKDQPFDLRVVVNRDVGSSGSQTPVKAKLRISRSNGEREEMFSEQEVILPPGKSVFTVNEKIEQADSYTYTAQVIPLDTSDDGTTRNNSSTAFTHVQGRGRVLLIQGAETPGSSDFLIDRLRKEGIEVTVRTGSAAFTSLPELQRYDSVILDDVPRASGDNADTIAAFTDAQIDMLVSNTKLGCGLIMLGGPNSFGVGGWTGTNIEKALPVDLQIKNKKIAPVGALVLMMHAGEMPNANFWQKKISVEAIKGLGFQDWAGMVEWNGNVGWLWNKNKGGMMKVGPNRKTMLSRIDRMMIGDMPDFDAPMKLAAAGFARLDQNPNAKPAVKHMIIISDGDPTPPTAATMNLYKKMNVSITTVSVPSHGMSDKKTISMMRGIATDTGGKHYLVRSGKALPRIYQREVRRIASPLVKEIPAPGLSPNVMQGHEIIKGLGSDIPPITGFVMTSVKDSPLVEVILTSSAVKDERNGTVLAAWTYGLGKSVALTTDTGTRWASSWTSWEGYDRLVSQMVRWTMRPLGDTGKYTLATDVLDGKTRVIVTALDTEDNFLNFQQMSGMVVGPDMKLTEVQIVQTAPGRYEGEFESTSQGSYTLAVMPGAGKGQLLSGVNVAYSNEFRDRETNLPLLHSIVELPAKGGKVGQFIEGSGATNELDKMLATNPFRRDLPKAMSVQEIWPLLVLWGSCLFFGDVFVRRVHVSFEWLSPALATLRNKLFRREQPVATEETMSRLKSKKAELDAAIDERKAASRFELTDEAEADPNILQQPEGGVFTPSSTKPQKRGEVSLDKKDQDDDSYTSRLLKAKKQVWKDRDKGS